MSKNTHFDILRRGVDVWNQWRMENPLIRPVLNYADLSGLSLENIILSGTDLIGANLSHAYLYDADFQDANLIDANLSRAGLIAANFYRANLSGACLDHAYLAQSDLSQADFTNACLHAADLQFAIMSQASFNSADLSKAVFTDGTGLTLEQVICAKSIHSADFENCLTTQELYQLDTRTSPDESESDRTAAYRQANRISQPSGETWQPAFSAEHTVASYPTSGSPAQNESVDNGDIEPAASQPAKRSILSRGRQRLLSFHPWPKQTVSPRV